MRAAFGISALLLALAPSGANASTQANQLAYDAARRCTIVATYLSGERGKAGDLAGAKRLDEQARRDFDRAFALGGALGRSDAQVTRDIDFTQTAELPRLMQDANYRTNLRATCRALGLME
jgi:hypothetical protein